MEWEIRPGEAVEARKWFRTNGWTTTRGEGRGWSWTRHDDPTDPDTKVLVEREFTRPGRPAVYRMVVLIG